LSKPELIVRQSAPGALAMAVTRGRAGEKHRKREVLQEGREYAPVAVRRGVAEVQAEAAEQIAGRRRRNRMRVRDARG